SGCGRREWSTLNRMSRPGLAVLRSLLLLKLADVLSRAVVDLRDIPAVEPGIRVDLAAVVDVVLHHHQQDAPPRQGAGGIDHFDPPLKPVVRGSANQHAKLGRT